MFARTPISIVEPTNIIIASEKALHGFSFENDGNFSSIIVIPQNFKSSNFFIYFETLVEVQ